MICAIWAWFPTRTATLLCLTFLDRTDVFVLIDASLTGLGNFNNDLSKPVYHMPENNE